jgi:hypothetical protein
VLGGDVGPRCCLWRRTHLAAPDAEMLTPAGASTGMEPAVTTTVPPQEPGRHSWADLLRLVGAVRRLAFDRTLPPSEAMGRIRDRSTTTTIRGPSVSD